MFAKFFFIDELSAEPANPNANGKLTLFTFQSPLAPLDSLLTCAL
jgi:hypothetical protein